MKYDVTIDFYGKQIRFKRVEAITKELPAKKAIESASKNMSVSAVTVSDPFEDAKNMFDSIFR